MPILQTLIILLTLLALAILFLLLQNLKQLKPRIKKLPPLVPSGRGYQHHLVGVNLRDFFDFPRALHNHPVIVAFASPTCMSCFKHLTEYLDDYGDQNAFLCILRSEGDEIDERFLKTFEGRFPLLKTTPDFMKNVLREPKTPIWMVTDARGVVKEVELNQKKLVKIYEQLLRPDSLPRKEA